MTLGVPMERWTAESQRLFKHLAMQEYTNVLVEGGSTLRGALFEEGLVG